MSASTTFGHFVLDRGRQQLTRGGQTVPIGHRGFLLLRTLLDAAGEPVSRETLMERIWPGTTVEEGNLTVQVSALRRHLGEGAESIIVTVPRIGYRLVAQAAIGDPARVDAGGPPLIAVLPFTNHGRVSEDGYFADGVVDDIITALSRFRTFSVVSRGSTFALRERGADMRTAVSELGVRYGLEGSIRRGGETLRVTAQVLDANTGTALWADSYDGALSEVFSFQDRITQSVVGIIEPTIRKAEIDRARRRPAASVDAYDLYLRALPMIDAPGPERHFEALGLLSRAANLDPGFALPRAYAALVYEMRLSMRLPTLGEHDEKTCIQLARSALELGADDPLVRAICGHVLFRMTDDKAALTGLRAAVGDNPNNVAILSFAAGSVGMDGCLEESIAYHKQAYALSPGSHEAYQNLFGIGASYFLLGNYEAAIEWSLKSLATFNELIYTYICLTCCYAALDRMDEATAMARRARALNPDLTIKQIEDGAADRADAFARGIVPWLHKVGFPAY